MPDSTYLSLHIQRKDAAAFEDLTSTSKDSDRFPGLLHIVCDEATPAELNAYKHLMFFGHHGSHENYGAQVFCCSGAGAIYTHPSDNEGNMSLCITDPWDTGAAPLQVPLFTMQFIIAARHIVVQLLDLAAEALQKELDAMEAAADTEASIAERAAALSGKKADKAKKAPAKKAGRKPKKG